MQHKTIPHIPAVLNYGEREKLEAPFAEQVPLPVAMATYTLRQYLFEKHIVKF